MRYTLTVCCSVEVNSMREAERALDDFRSYAHSAISECGIVISTACYPDSTGGQGLIATGRGSGGLPLETPEQTGDTEATGEGAEESDS